MPQAHSMLDAREGDVWGSRHRVGQGCQFELGILTSVPLVHSCSPCSYLTLPAVDLEPLKAEFQDDSPTPGTVLGEDRKGVILALRPCLVSAPSSPPLHPSGTNTLCALLLWGTGHRKERNTEGGSPLNLPLLPSMGPACSMP